jgi:hypothetical protein
MRAILMTFLNRFLDLTSRLPHNLTLLTYYVLFFIYSYETNDKLANIKLCVYEKFCIHLAIELSEFVFMLEFVAQFFILYYFNNNNFKN